MNPRKLTLLIIAFFFIVIFFNIPQNRTWLDDRILDLTQEIYDQQDQKTYEQRKAYRMGTTYEFCKGITEIIKRANVKEPLVLLPPQSYVKKMGSDLLIPEPVVFYYFTGLKSTTPDAKDVFKANCYVDMGDGKVSFFIVSDSSIITDVLNSYKSHQ